MADSYNGTNGNSAGGVLFTNVRILDGTGEYPYTGEVSVQGNRIRHVTKGSSRMSGAVGGGSQTVIDGMGATLMPGLCDAHLHLSWNNAPGIDPIQMMPPEETRLSPRKWPSSCSTPASRWVVAPRQPSRALMSSSAMRSIRA